VERNLHAWKYSSNVIGFTLGFLTFLFNNAERALVRRVFEAVVPKFFDAISVTTFQFLERRVFELINQCHNLSLLKETQMIAHKLEKTALDGEEATFTEFLLPLARRLCDADSLGDTDLTLQLPKTILMIYTSHIVGPKPDEQAEAWQNDRLRAHFNEEALSKVLGPGAQIFLTSD
jgi:hypothetical protein